MEHTKEIARIKEVYERRKESVPSRLYSFFNRANLFMVQSRDRALLKALASHGIVSLEDKKVLDVGCGEGRELRNLMRFGARPENLYGVDLLPDRIESAAAISPNIDFQCGNAESLPYQNETFDIVIQFTVFTSILDKAMKRAVAGEMLRVLKPQGIILWYDYHMDNPGNPDVRGVKKKEIYELFRECTISLKRITLAPPLVRMLAPHSVILCHLLEKLPFFCTHYLALVRKDE